jgi:hypothetical protein
MALPNLFSRRKRLSAGTTADVYRYDAVPQNVRVQVFHILRKGMGPSSEGHYGRINLPAFGLYQHIVETMREEKGVVSLTPVQSDGYDEEYFRWLLSEQAIDHYFDGVELGLRCIDKFVREEYYKYQNYVSKTPDQAIHEFNARMLEAGIGYQYETGQIFRMDSGEIHSEVVKPALQLIGKRGFEAANREYRAAHDAFRSRDYETCLTECAKAFESVLKVIGTKRKWSHVQNASSKQLLDQAFDTGFIGQELKSEFTSLRSLLESGVPVLRNKMAAHGAGTKTRTIPPHFASFQLHQTACAIVFLVEQYDSSK